jgi:hypothetical protein
MLVQKYDIKKTVNNKPILETSTLSMKALKENVQYGRSKIMESIMNESKNQKLHLIHDLFYIRNF